MKKAFFSVVFLFLILTTFSQILEPVKWNFKTVRNSDREAELQLIASADKGWHIYSQYIVIPKGKIGPDNTIFSFDKTGDYQLVGKVVEPKATEEYDPNFEINLKFFSGKTVFRQKIRILNDKAFTVRGRLEFMCCDDKQCMTPTEVEFSFPIEKAKQPFRVEANAGNGSQDSTRVVKKDSALAKVSADSAIITSKSYKPLNAGKDSTLWWFFFISFLAGLAAILTPCVFPMIPMTVTFFMHDNQSKRRARMQALVYGFSIIAIYTIIGTLVAVTLGANFANWLSTHWLPNIFFFVVFLVFAASFLGMFEITLPSWMVNKADKKADKGGYSGAFFMAFTLVLVSFSCTGPIVGAILVQSAGGQILQPIIGMFGFSLAFALPFALFAFFPSWLSGLPKSGGWLNSVKVVLGFLELALGLKFLSIADQTYHWGILDREIYLAFWIVIFTLMGFYLLGKLQFAHDSEVKHISVPRLTLAIITFTFVVYMIPGMFGAPLKALAGYLPPQQTHDFDLNAIIRDNALSHSGSSGGEFTGLCDTPKFGDILELPHGLKGYFDYEQGLACARKQNKPVFVDFTGHGCVNCREMEADVWSDPRVLKKLREDFIVMALYVDDKTDLPESEWITSRVDGKVKKTIGKKFADFQIEHFNVNAQPYYVLLDGKGKLLTDPKAYDLNVENFIKFLDAGLEAFRKQKK